MLEAANNKGVGDRSKGHWLPVLVNPNVMRLERIWGDASQPPRIVQEVERQIPETATGDQPKSRIRSVEQAQDLR